MKTGMRLWLPALVLLWGVESGQAQTLVAVEDSYEAPAEQTLIVGAPGVLENDTDGGGENLPPTAAAELRSDVSNGTLSLSPDGSFTYTPTGGFPGSDSFVYRVVDGAEVSNEATVTVTVTGCTSTAPVSVCWVEAAYVAKLQALGYSTFPESFEEDITWGSVRSPDTAASITSRGITWTSNNVTSEITTGGGPARTGSWGFFSLPHGDLSNGPTSPIHDGFSGAAAGTLVGVGGWLISNTGGAQVRFILTSPPNPPVIVDFADAAVTSQHKFFGAIDTRGFVTFEIYETEGVVEDQEYIFADDFTLGANACLSDPPVTGCIDGDGCCPAACNPGNDDDCAVTTTTTSTTTTSTTATSTTAISTTTTSATTTSTTTTTTFAHLVGHKVSVSRYGGNPPAGRLYKIVIKANSDGNETDYPLGFPLPTDPATNGGSVTVSRDGGTLTDPLTAGSWRGLGNPAGSKGWKYKNTGAPSGGAVKIALIKSKVIKVVAKGTGTMPVPTGADGQIDTTIAADDQRYCAEAEPLHFRDLAGKLIKSRSSTETLRPAACGSPSSAFLDMSNRPLK